jgi:hypothetical protein
MGAEIDGGVLKGCVNIGAMPLAPWRMRLVVTYVKHSLDDAVAVGDRLAVMREGRIEQIGAL